MSYLGFEWFFVTVRVSVTSEFSSICFEQRSRRGPLSLIHMRVQTCQELTGEDCNQVALICLNSA